MKRLVLCILLLVMLSSVSCVWADENATRLDTSDDASLSRNRTTFIFIDSYPSENSVDVSVTLEEDATGDVSFSIFNESSTFSKVVDVKNGKAEYVQSGLFPGSYNLTAKYSGDSVFYPTDIEDSFSIERSNTNIFVSLKTDGENVDISAEVDKSATGEVHFNITGAENDFKKVAIQNGRAESFFTLKPGEYSYIVTYMGDNRFKGNSKSDQFSIRRTTDLHLSTDIRADAAVFTAKLPDDATGEVLFKITGPLKLSRYVAVEKGEAICVKDELPLGDYKLTASYDGDDKYMGSSASLTFSITERNARFTIKPLNVEYGIGKKVVVTLTDGDGNPLKRTGVNVIFNGESHNIKTNSKGQIRLSTKGLKPDSYEISAFFGGNDNYFPAEKNATVVVKKATVKLKVIKSNRKFSVLLKDKSGSPVKKLKIKFRTGSKTYTAKSNGKGVATFKLAKKGLYSGTVKFGGNKYYNPLNKKVKFFIR